jgi:hypothetical protein
MSAILNMLLAAKGRAPIYTGSLMSGAYVASTTTFYGLFSDAFSGSISPATFTGAGTTLTIKRAYDLVNPSFPVYSSSILITGFTSDPGATFISSAQWGTGSLLTRVSYTYTAGTPNQGQWNFSTAATPNFGFQAGVGTTQTFNIFG